MSKQSNASKRQKHVKNPSKVATSIWSFDKLRKDEMGPKFRTGIIDPLDKEGSGSLKKGADAMKYIREPQKSTSIESPAKVQLGEGPIPINQDSPAVHENKPLNAAGESDTVNLGGDILAPVESPQRTEDRPITTIIITIGAYILGFLLVIFLTVVLLRRRRLRIREAELQHLSALGKARKEQEKPLPEFPKIITPASPLTPTMVTTKPSTTSNLSEATQVPADPKLAWSKIHTADGQTTTIRGSWEISETTSANTPEPESLSRPVSKDV